MLDMDGRVKEAIAALGEVAVMTVNPNYNVDSLDANKEVDDEGNTTVHLYNAAHGKTPRTGGPYLDDLEREKAEEIRAKMEDREPDLENPPAVAGTVLVPKSALVDNDVDKSHMSATTEVTNEPVGSYEVPAEVSEPDPTQAAWDNDMSKLNALKAAKEYEELTKGAEKSEKPEPKKTTTSKKSDV